MKQLSKQIILSMMTIVLSWNANAQVGIETSDPKATLDVLGKPTEVGVPDGIIAPRVSRAALIAKTVYGNNQVGAILYVTDLTGTTNTATSEVLAIGYYYFDGTKWKSFSTSSVQTANYAWSQSNAYLQGTIVTNNNLLYQANGTIPANTAFAVGTSGATWRQIAASAPIFGENLLPQNVLLNNNTIVDLLTVSIPSAGYWEIEYSLNVESGGGNSNDGGSFWIVSASNINNEIIGSGQQHYMTSQSNGSVSLNRKIFVETIGPATYYVRGQRFSDATDVRVLGGGLVSTHGGFNTQRGSSKVTWKRL